MSTGAQELRHWRKAADLSQQDLAVKVHMHAASIGQYERGIQHPRRDAAQSLDDALEAGGAVLAAFGYRPTGESVISPPADVSQELQEWRAGVMEQVLGVIDDMKQMERNHQTLRGEVAALRVLVEGGRVGRESV